jgi:hypothetical protein
VETLPLAIDAFNVVTTVRVALAGGLVLLCRDGSARDLAGVHGRHRPDPDTDAALELLGNRIAHLKVGRCDWYVDRNVSRSADFAASLRRTAKTHAWDWNAHVVTDPDALLCKSRAGVVSSDRRILDRCAQWFNLARDTIDAAELSYTRVDLTDMTPHEGNP